MHVAYETQKDFLPYATELMRMSDLNAENRNTTNYNNVRVQNAHVKVVFDMYSLRPHDALASSATSGRQTATRERCSEWNQSKHVFSSTRRHQWSGSAGGSGSAVGWPPSTFSVGSAVASARFVTDLLLRHWKSTCRLLASSFSHDMWMNGRCT